MSTNGNAKQKDWVLFPTKLMMKELKDRCNFRQW
jgi:hypothetical protein